MTLRNISLIENLAEFNDISPDVRVQFSVKRGNKNHSLGRGNRGFTCRERPYCLTTYQLSYTGLKKQEADELRSIVDALKHQIKFFPFNDFSDNYVFEWEQGAVRQNGVLVEIGGAYDVNTDTTSYKLCKRYSVGQNYTLKPIHYFPEEAEIVVNGDDNTFVDRENGRVDGLVTGLDGAPFEADLYYTLVRVSSDVSISTYYDEGLNNVIDETQVESDAQRFTVSFSLTEVRINEVLNYTNRVDDPELPLIENVDLNCFIAGASLTEKTLYNKYEQNGFWAAENPHNSIPTTVLTVPSRITKHRELIHFMTMFKGCGGTSFDIDRP